MKRSTTMKLFAAAVLGLAGAGCQSAPQTVSTITSPVPPAATPTPLNMLGVSGYGPPGPVTIWQKLGLGKQQLEACRRSLCDSPAGALMGAAISPVSKLTGGLIPPLCSPVPTLGELLDPGVIGANSKVKQDKANAEKRKKAIEELAGVDCHYWPEAEDALIGALRADRNECVRHTAALALQRGCCCTKKTIEALSICVSGSEADGHPCEKSDRVRAAAAVALEQCLERACCPTCPIPEGAIFGGTKTDDNNKGGTGETPPKGEQAPTPKKEGTNDSSQVSWSKPGPVAEDVDADVAARKFAKAYYEKVKQKSMEELLAKARHCLNTMRPLPLDLSVPAGHPDYEAAGVRTHLTSPDRPANLLDMLNGHDSSDRTAKLMSQPLPKHAVTQSTIEPTVVAKPVVKAVEMPKPTPKPLTPVPVTVSAPIPAPMPAKAASIAVTVAPPKPLPVRTASNASHVLKMLEEPSDMAELRMAVDMLTAADVKDTKLTLALLKAAEYPSDTGFRVACLKAVSRSKTKTVEAKASVQKIATDKDAAVAGEAAKLLAEMQR